MPTYEVNQKAVAHARNLIDARRHVIRCKWQDAQVNGEPTLHVNSQDITKPPAPISKHRGRNTEHCWRSARPEPNTD